MKDRPNGFDDAMADAAAEVFVAGLEQVRVHGLVVRPDLTLDIFRRKVIVGSRVERLLRKEVQILDYLCSNSGRALSYEEIYVGVWGQEFSENDVVTVRVHVGRIRKKLKGPDKKGPSPIKTIHGRGLLMVAPEDLKS